MAQETGRVNEKREALVVLRLVNGAQIECAVDTGFDGAIMLPRNFIATQGFSVSGGEYFHTVSSLEPDIAETVTAGVEWLGEEFDITILVSELGFALIGTEMLLGCTLLVDYLNGTVAITQFALTT